MRILIAEDDVTSRAVLEGILTQLGHEVVTTVNGVEALEILQQPDSPMLAILDWMMPELSGVEVIQEVRSIPTDSPPFLILLTAKDKKTDVVDGLNVGANDYLVKPYDKGELIARIGVGKRMIDLQAALVESQKDLAHQATHDPLTGAMNRRAIMASLEKDLERTLREDSVLGIGLLDIDHFKAVNDTYGHQTGDDVLCELVRTINSGLRKYDSLGRIGGEEFVVVMPGKVGADSVSQFERLRSSIQKTKMKTRTGDLAITVSVGVVCAPPGASIDDLLAMADEALYQAKAGGRNRVTLAESSLHEDAVP
ncbi:diguanylate cyclase [Maridesulfovibrio ferrireducens]|uniref:GGDEF domain-containing response regulator n=1 Tax=Maridesulfovibrio ferrireducens TaxID=246191 RepID=UPI001A35C074|nr:diguanylate cyclase [Maridesulfovibrio ferrireducens]MBI9113305.1 diguanylate cyclase [Maridesulfovibrio ferrireducens]